MDTAKHSVPFTVAQSVPSSQPSSKSPVCDLTAKLGPPPATEEKKPKKSKSEHQQPLPQTPQTPPPAYTPGDGESVLKAEFKAVLHKLVQASESIPIRTMKYLSFIIGLLLLATLFSFVLTQLNKDETKHEYGIAFPLEESESRLPPLSSVVQLEVDAAKVSSLKDPESATTTTETVATSPAKTGSAEASAGAPESAAVEIVKASVPSEGDSEISVLSGESADGGSSIIIESSASSSSSSNDSSNDADGEGSKDSSSEEGVSEGSQSPLGAKSPKLVFIERLMGLNFQRAPSGGFSSFLEMRGESSDASADEKANSNNDNNNNKTEASSAGSEENDGSKGDDASSPELPWGNSIESLRSRWESRIRKFTFPFQNSYSVVLRASGMATDPRDASESKDSVSTDSSDSSSSSSSAGDNFDNSEKSIIKPVNLPDRSPLEGLAGDQPMSFSGPKFFFQSSSSGPLGQSESSSSSSSSPGQPKPQETGSSQANQLLRMAALSMMSKLFTALRNQAVYDSNTKMDSVTGRFGGAGGAPSSLDHTHHHHHHSHSLSALEGHDLDLDDDDEENDIDSEKGGAAAEGLPVPFIIARPNRMSPLDSSVSSSSYGYGNDGQSSPVRQTSVMFGRPSTAAAAHHHQGPIMMTQRIFSSSSSDNSGHSSNSEMSPLAAILAAAAARHRRMESMQQQQQQEQPQPSQPQRLILLISHRPSSAPAASSRDEMISPMSPVSVASRLQMFGRDEQLGYPQSSSPTPPALFQYAPLSPPASPIYYHFSPQASAQSSSSSQAAAELIRPSALVQSIAASLQAAQSQVQPQPHQSQAVMAEVPVPFYLPMAVMGGHRSMGSHRQQQQQQQSMSAPLSASSVVGHAPIRRLVSLQPRTVMMMPAEPRGLPVELPMSLSGNAGNNGNSNGGNGNGGHVALLMVQHASPSGQADTTLGDSLSESLAIPHHVEPSASSSPLLSSSSTFSEASNDQPASGFVRIFLRPRMSPALPTSRIAFHRRLDDSAESDDMPVSSAHHHHQLLQGNSLIAAAAHHAAVEAAAAAAASASSQSLPSSSSLDSARLRQWRDYSQFVRSAPAPMASGSGSSSSSFSHKAPVAHLLIAASPSNNRVDHEASGSEEQYQQQPLHFGAPMQQQFPFFFHAHPQQQQQQQADSGHQLPHPLMMAAQRLSSNSQAVHSASPQQQQQQQHAAAFFIVADPSSSGGSQSEGAAANSGNIDA